MHTLEIRGIYLRCGHHELRTVTGSIFATDYCRTAGKTCGDIKVCLPEARTPRAEKPPRKRKNPIHLLQPDFELPDFGPPPRWPKRLC